METAARYHAWAGQCFVVSASSRIDHELLKRLDLVDQPNMIRTGGGWGAMVSPTGRMLAGPNTDDETMLVADVDLSEIVFLKYACDSAGHYSPSDILRLATNLTAQSVTQPFGV